MVQRMIRNVLVLLVLSWVLATGAVALAEDGPTPEQVAMAEREFTYTTVEAVAAGQLAAERYWLYTHTIYEIIAADREFTYTTAEAVQKGKVAAEAYWEAQETIMP